MKKIHWKKYAVIVLACVCAAFAIVIYAQNYKLKNLEFKMESSVENSYQNCRNSLRNVIYFTLDYEDGQCDARESLRAADIYDTLLGQNLSSLQDLGSDRESDADMGLRGLLAVVRKHLGMLEDSSDSEKKLREIDQWLAEHEDVFAFPMEECEELFLKELEGRY